LACEWNTHSYASTTYAGPAKDRVGLVDVDVDAREALALEQITDHDTTFVDRGAGTVDRRWALGGPATRLL
jgi:hypothetical protein